MAKAIFMTRPDTMYDDLPEIRYHFPKQYLNQARKAERDWIIYYETGGGGGRMAYYATAYLERIEQDARASDSYYAIISHYFEFLRAVPFKDESGALESALIKPDGSVNKGKLGWSIHEIPEAEFNAILMAGTAEYFPALQTEAFEIEESSEGILPKLIRGPYRDRAFGEMVRVAYRDTCAITGVRLVNGGGAAEVEAAHIRPASSDGPDSLRNGIALSRTIHWAFDKGLLALEDDGKILVARKLIPEQLNRLIVPDGIARIPKAKGLQPHPQFLRFHRENVFRG